MKTYDLITFGEAMGMFISNDVGSLEDMKHFTKELAGAETNVSIGLSRLGFNVAWCSKVGTDPIGKFIINELKKEGVDTSFVKLDADRLTGFQLKEKVVVGDPSVSYFRKHSAASSMTMNDLIELDNVYSKHFHITGIPLALSDKMVEITQHMIDKARQDHATVSFDPNLRPSLWKTESEMIETIQSIAVQADYLFPGISEGRLLTGLHDPEDIAQFYLAKGVKVVVIKLGAEGALVATNESETYVQGFQVTSVVDTVGAGDGFAVGMLSGIFDGLSFEEAAQRANAIGALAVMSPGDKEGLPTRMQLEKFINKRGAVS